ncbi:MAG: YukJ family protein [Thermodesulfobacteriota bacterium]
MPVKYAVLVGTVIGGDRQDDDPKSPHYQIFVTAAERTYRVPVNVQSADGSEVMFFHDKHFTDPITDRLRLLEQGLHRVKARPDGLALDYVRGKYFRREEMKTLPASQAGDDNDLQDLIGHLVATSKLHRNDGSEVFVFGEAFSGGVHDVHMNQGNQGKWKKDNGVWQDGGLIFYDPIKGGFEAVFLAFRTQSWHTNDKTGNPE